MLYKRNLKDALLTWGLSTFAGEQTAVDWIQNVVTRKVQNFSTWAVLLKSGDVAWRAGRHPAEIGWLNFLTEATFGTSYDAPIKVAMKASEKPEEALGKDTFAVIVGSITSKLDKPTSDNKQDDPGHGDDAVPPPQGRSSSRCRWPRGWAVPRGGRLRR